MIIDYRRSYIGIVISIYTACLLWADFAKTLAANSKNILKSDFIPRALVVIALGLVIAGSAISLMEWRANAITNRQAEATISRANRAAPTAPAISANGAAPTTNKPSDNTLNNYAVGPSQPRILTIPKLGVNARVLSVGLTKEGAIAAPANVYDTAWYDQSAQPGQPGAMFIDGHVSSWTTQGVFHGLKTLRQGDLIQIKRGDGAIFNYHVVMTKVYEANGVDMDAAMAPINPSRPGLNIMSCSGKVAPGTNEFSQRIVVFAQQV
ncbi:MAG: class F sortase [Patescibacteria group bacterium]